MLCKFEEDNYMPDAIALAANILNTHLLTNLVNNNFIKIYYVTETLLF
jgi:hypothetical protein